MSKFLFRDAICKCCQELVFDDGHGLQDVVAQIFDPDLWAEWMKKYRAAAFDVVDVPKEKKS